MAMVNVRRAAFMANVSEATIRNWIRKDRVKSDTSDMRQWMVDVDSLQAYARDGLITDKDGTVWLEASSARRMFGLKESCLARWARLKMIETNADAFPGRKLLYHRDSLAAKVRSAAA